MIAAQKNDEKKDRALAALITLVICVALFLILLFIKIITPLPPFPEMAGGGGEELNFGIYNEGTGNVEGPGIGEVTSVVVENTSTPKSEESAASEENFKNGEAVLEENNEKPKIKDNKTVITQTKTKEEIQKEKEAEAANSILNAYTKNKTKTGQTGGDGNSGQAGNEGSPDGNPNTDGKGGHGHGDGTGDGDGKGPGPGGPGGSGVSGRKMIAPPPKVTDSKEEGIVVVVITVDKQGNVIDADPTGKGTNTSSAVLKSKARQAALQAKFSSSDKYEAQKGTIIFRFQF